MSKLLNAMKDFMGKYNLTQGKFADWVGIDQHAIHKIIEDPNNINDYNYNKVATYLNTFDYEIAPRLTENRKRYLKIKNKIHEYFGEEWAEEKGIGLMKLAKMLNVDLPKNGYSNFLQNVSMYPIWEDKGIVGVLE